MAEDNSIRSAIESIVPVLERLGLRYAIIGGVAVILRGYNRSTEDVDMVVLNVDPVFNTLISELGRSGYKSRVADPREFANDTRMILVADKSGTHIDLSMGRIPYEEQLVERSTSEQYGENVFAMVAHAQDLVIMKMLAFRDRDRDDVLRLKELHADIDWETVRNHVLEICEMMEDNGRLTYLEWLLQSKR